MTRASVALDVRVRSDPCRIRHYGICPLEDRYDDVASIVITRSARVLTGNHADPNLSWSRLPWEWRSVLACEKVHCPRFGLSEIAIVESPALQKIEGKK